MGPPRPNTANLTTGEQTNTQLVNAQSRLSHTHARLLSALDALDSLRTSHHREISTLAQQKRSQGAKIRVYEERLQRLEAERDDMRDAVEQLVEQVERSNDYSVWPCSRMQISGDFAEPSQFSSTSRNASSNTSDFAPYIASTLRSQLVAERTAHDQAKVRVAELEAKVARREAEIERLLMAQSISNTQESQPPNDAVIDMLDANVRRNRMLELEIKELTAKLDNKRSSAASQVENNGSNPGPSTPSGTSTGVRGTVVRLNRELEELSAAIDGLQGVRTDFQKRRHAEPNPRPSGSSSSQSRSNGARPENSPVLRTSVQIREIRVPSPQTTQTVQQQLAPPLYAPSPLRSSPATSNPDWTGLRTPEPTVTLTLGSPVTIEARPLRSNGGLTVPANPRYPSDDDGERSMELATPLPSSSIVTSGRLSATPGRRLRSHSNTPRRPPSRSHSRIESPGTPMEIATPLPSTSIVTSIARSRSENTPHRTRAMTWSNPPSPSPSHHSAQYSQTYTQTQLSHVSPGTPTPLSRSQNSEASLTRSTRLDMSPDSRPPSSLRLSPRFVPLPPSSEENTDSTRGRRRRRRRASQSSISTLEWEGDEGREGGEDSFEREYSRERRQLHENESDARRHGQESDHRRLQEPGSENEEVGRLRGDLDEAKGRLMDGERALGELTDVFEGLRRVLVARSSPRSHRHSSTSS